MSIMIKPVCLKVVLVLLILVGISLRVCSILRLSILDSLDETTLTSTHAHDISSSDHFALGFHHLLLHICCCGIRVLLEV